MHEMKHQPFFPKSLTTDQRCRRMLILQSSLGSSRPQLPLYSSFSMYRFSCFLHTKLSAIASTSTSFWLYFAQVSMTWTVIHKNSILIFSSPSRRVHDTRRSSGIKIGRRDTRIGRCRRSSFRSWLLWASLFIIHPSHGSVSTIHSFLYYSIWFFSASKHAALQFSKNWSSYL